MQVFQSQRHASVLEEALAIYHFFTTISIPYPRVIQTQKKLLCNPVYITRVSIHIGHRRCSASGAMSGKTQFLLNQIPFSSVPHPWVSTQNEKKSTYFVYLQVFQLVEGVRTSVSESESGRNQLGIPGMPAAIFLRLLCGTIAGLNIHCVVISIEPRSSPGGSSPVFSFKSYLFFLYFFVFINSIFFVFS